MTLNDAINAMAVAVQATESDVTLLVRTLRKLVHAVEFSSGASSSYPKEMIEAWDVVDRFAHIEDEPKEPKEPEMNPALASIEF